MKSSILAAVVLTGLASSAQAQQFGVAGVGGNAFAAGTGLGFGGTGFNSGYNGFGYNGFSNGGVVGYPGANYGYGYGAMPSYRAVPQTANNLLGLGNAIRASTGRGNSYRPGFAGIAPGGRRR